MKYDLLEPLKEHLYSTMTRNTARKYYGSVVRLLEGKQCNTLKELEGQITEEGIRAFQTRSEFSGVKNGLKHLKQVYPGLLIPSEEQFLEISGRKRNYSKKPKKTLYLEEIRRKVNQIGSKKLKYAYRLALVSGLRVSELAALEGGDLTFGESGSISVNVRHGKGGSNGVVECMEDPYLYRGLQEYIKENPEGRLFYSEAYLRQKAHELGLECHDFRRIFAITFRNRAGKEMPLMEANALTQKKLRHERFSTTKRYLFNRKLKIKGRREKGMGTDKKGAGSMDRELENIIGQLLMGLFWILSYLLKGLACGFKKLRKKRYFLIFLCSFSVTGAAYFFRLELSRLDLPAFVSTMLYGMLLAFPAFMVVVFGHLGDRLRKKFQRSFEEIGFQGKDGKYPYFCGSSEQEKKIVCCFRSTIPLTEWKSSRARLETGLDCNILLIEEGSNKRIVKVTTVPNSYRIPTMLYWSDRYLRERGIITIGQSALREITFHLNRTPHVLVAGETGSGKSVILRACLWQMIHQGARVYMIDFKGGVEFGKRYEQFGEVVTERERALKVLTGLVNENQKRLVLFREMEVKNVDEYNQKTQRNLCRIGVFCDEIAEMLDKKGVSKEDKGIYEQLEGKISTLARLSRATGINLFLGVQRPDANVLTGQIKNNIPVRISGRFADKAASEIVLGNTDATELPDIKGRFLFKAGNETIEFQSYFFDDEKMLHDIHTEPGDMLMELPGAPGVYGNAGCQPEKPSEEMEKGRRFVREEKNKRKPAVLKKEVCYTEAEMEAMDAYDLDFSFETGEK